MSSPVTTFDAVDPEIFKTDQDVEDFAQLLAEAKQQELPEAAAAKEDQK